MTMQMPYPPPQQPPAPAYPTAPPWAEPPAAVDETAVQPGMTTPWGAPHTEHGQLLVPYPEEMQNAARAEAPGWLPVVVWTAIFGIFGAISAARRAEQARRGRNSAAPYWVAFGVTQVIMAVVAAMVWSVAVPAYLDQREDALTRAVQSAMTSDGQMESVLRSAAASATCEPTGDRLDGLRPYTCVVSLEDGRTETLRVQGDTGGAWSLVK